MNIYFYLLKHCLSACGAILLLIHVGFLLLYFREHTIFQASSLSQAYFNYLNCLFHGDVTFFSLTQNEKIKTHLLTYLPATFEFYLYSFIIALLIGIPFGLFAGLVNDKWSILTESIFLIIKSSPVTWICILSVFFFFSKSLEMSLFQFDEKLIAPRWSGFFFIDIWRVEPQMRATLIFNKLMQLGLPLFVLCVFNITFITSVVTKSTQYIVKQNYIKMAYVRGESLFSIIKKHIIPNSLPAIINNTILYLSVFISLTMIVEILFNLPGMGFWIYGAYHNNDLLIIVISMISLGTIITLVNLFGLFLRLFFAPLKYKDDYVS